MRVVKKFGKFFAITFVFFALVLSLGCATGVRLPETAKAGKIPDDIGLVIVSAGGKWTSSFGHYVVVSYEVAREESPGLLKKVDFIPSELMNAGNMDGDIGDENYGYIHIFELPVGTYYFVGIDKQASNFRVGDVVPVNSGKKDGSPNIILSVTIAGGRINYLGEMVATGKPLSNASVKISNMWQRDKNTALKLNPKLASHEFIYNPPDKVSEK